jgi:hypothetical protein
LNGHVTYGLATGKYSFLAELGEASAFAQWTKDRIEDQVLEIDADTCAAGRLMYTVRELAARPPWPNPHLQSHANIMFAAAFAMFSCFRIFGDEPLAIDDVCKGRHPPFRLRLGYVIGSILAFCLDHGITMESQQEWPTLY